MIDQTPRELLTAWLRRKLAEGVPSDDLPSPEDIEKLAAKGLDAHLPLDNRPAVEQHRPELQRLLSADPFGDVVTDPIPVDREPVSDVPDQVPGDQPGPGYPAVDTSPLPASPPSEPRPEAGSFAPYELADGIGRPAPPPLHHVQITPEGDLRYRWTPQVTADRAARTTIYRVVARDDHMPFSPDDPSCLLAVTEQTETIDRRPLTAAIRYVQVWSNAGSDDRRARAEQPVVVAQDAVVAPASGVHIAQDGAQVTGEWTVRPGVRRVEVYRLPAARAQAFSDPDYLVSSTRANLGGFIDEDLAPGTYLYRVYAVAETEDGEELRSVPVIRPVTVRAPLAPVTDLRIVSPAGADTLTLEWTAPLLGEVQIYRTDQGPAPGVSEAEIPADAVNGTGGLPAEQRLRREIERVGPVQRLTRVTVPAATTAGEKAGRLYFTPVTLNQDQAWIGRSVVHYRFGEIVSPWLVQRVEWQLVSFGWPIGATTVHAHVTPRGEPVRRPLENPIARIDQEEYRLQGGLVLRDVLPASPCDIHLTPVLGGPQSNVGRTVTLHYPGLIRTWYQMPKKLSLRRERSVSIYCDSTVQSMLRFVAIHRSDRLPLSIDDGAQIGQWFSALRQGEWMPLGEIAPRAGGFVRIFIDLPDVPVDVAMIDPPVDQLKW